MNAITQTIFVTDYTVAASIEAIAWNRTDMLDALSQDANDTMEVARDWSEVAIEIYEDEANITVNRNIVRLIITSLHSRLDQEVRRRDWEFNLEYAARVRSGRIDANGCGDTPVWGA